MGRMKKRMIATAMVAIMSISLVPAAFAADPQEQKLESVISHSERWVDSNKKVEITEYDLGDGFTAIETVLDEYNVGLTRNSGTKTQEKTVEIKNGTSVAATITVSGTFTYDGKKATVTSYSHSRTVKPGYTETGWGASKGNSGLLNDAYVSAKLTVKQTSTSKSFSKTAEITCSKNGD
ncbi:hypothetical protein [Flavonifractor sp. An9]|uniref:hypothetical protein n=1 Tax=Flavonifractor sp. An9 TaxID=1965664 RepID=UPI000B370976|nr:hypothetical protein [Flavonifractor sp. An9]OUN12026.1 hypothetical protein B5G40_04970 [Flavonifractor sp. An9]